MSKHFLHSDPESLELYRHDFCHTFSLNVQVLLIKRMVSAYSLFKTIYCKSTGALLKRKRVIGGTTGKVLVHLRVEG